MSRASLTAVAVLISISGLGCWEQVSKDWFEQMKDQPAIQALEDVQPLMPPDGTIPVGGLEPRIAATNPMPAFTPGAMALQNPIPPSVASVTRGKEVYGIYCAVCHGLDGMANQEQLPVAKRMAESNAPPTPLHAVPAYSDGIIFTKIRYGKPMMPGYPQIPPEDRWHVVNYLRTLIKGS